MLTFPTQMCIQLASNMKLFDVTDPRKLNSHTGLKLFQQMAVGGTLDEAMSVFDITVANDLMAEDISKEYEKTHYLEGHVVLRLVEEDRAILKLIYSLTKQELLGIAVEVVMQTMSESTAPKKEKLAGAAIMEQMFGEGDATKTSALTDKLVINLVGGTDKA